MLQHGIPNYRYCVVFVAFASCSSNGGDRVLFSFISFVSLHVCVSCFVALLLCYMRLLPRRWYENISSVDFPYVIQSTSQCERGLNLLCAFDGGIQKLYHHLISSYSIFWNSHLSKPSAHWLAGEVEHLEC